MPPEICWSRNASSKQQNGVMCFIVSYLEVELFENPFVIPVGSVQAPATCSGQPAVINQNTGEASQPKKKNLFAFKRLINRLKVLGADPADTNSVIVCEMGERFFTAEVHSGGKDVQHPVLIFIKFFWTLRFVLQ